MNTSHSRPAPLTRRERRQRARDLAKRTTIRPARPGDFGAVPIPPGAMVIETQLAEGVRHKRLIAREEAK